VGITRVACFGISTFLAFVGVSASPATASAPVNPNPVDWRIVTTFLGRNGEDVPLRVGRRNAGPFAGPGVVHIEEGHGLVPPHGYIERALMEGKCRPLPDRMECLVRVSNYQQVLVAFTERVDPNCPDGRPVGVITAYYINVCLPCRDHSST
jgi:hypothetical protein